VIVTLCGSVKYESDFHTAALELGRRGIVVFSLAAFPSLGNDVSTRGQPLEDSGYDKVMLDLGYFYKIAKSDAVLVMGSGYVGLSTSREILWAQMLGKTVVHQLTQDWDAIVARLQSGKTDGHLIHRAMLVLKGELNE